MSAKDTAERRQYLSFALAGSDYAVGILQVKEILQYETVTRVPSVPPSIRGVINLRGAVVPVIDLAVKFGLPATPVTKRTCVLIAEAALGGERTVVGVVADAVREVLELGPEEIEPAPSFGTHVRVDFLTGMGRAGKGFVLLLDLDRVISAGELDLAGHLPGEPLGGGAADSVSPAADQAPPEARVAAAAALGKDGPHPGTPKADGGSVPLEIEQAIRAHLQWKVRIRSAVECGKLQVPIQTLRADDQCAFGRWLYGSSLPAELRGTEQLASVRRLHKAFHQTTAEVAELALAGRREDAERAVADDGSFTLASNALLEVLRAWR